jgi:cell division protein FtsA
MFDDFNVIAGLEVGTSKICVVIGKLGADGELKIIGVGQALSQGVRKGEVINPDQVAEDLRTAIFEAEQMADVEIRSVVLGVTGGHIRGFNSRGLHPVISADREISPEDVEDAIKNAKAISLPPENAVLHTVHQLFHVDGQTGVANPVGMIGARLAVDVHVIHGNAYRLQNLGRLVRGMALKVDDVVFNGIASALALLTGEQKELGALVIDIGGGTTEYVVYLDGVIRHSGVLAVGGDHVSNDLAFGLKIPLRRAEKLKIAHGCAVVTEAAKGQTVSLINEFGHELKRIKIEHIQIIMTERLGELFKLIAQDLDRVGLTRYLRAGVFICGGGSRVPGLVTLAERIFHMKVTIGQNVAISGLVDTLNQPEFSTALGLVKLGASLRQTQRITGSLREQIRAILGKIAAILKASLARLRD